MRVCLGQTIASDTANLQGIVTNYSSDCAVVNKKDGCIVYLLKSHCVCILFPTYCAH